MRLVTYRVDGEGRAGVLTDAGVLDAAGLLGVDRIGVRELIGSGRIEDLAGASADPTVDPIEHPEPLPPVTDPDKIICIGLNYRSHAAEAGIDPPEQPTFFAKFRNALAAPGATVALPLSSEKVDYEAEVAFVVGRRCKEIGDDEAHDAEAGYWLMLDLYDL